MPTRNAFIFSSAVPKLRLRRFLKDPNKKTTNRSSHTHKLGLLRVVGDLKKKSIQSALWLHKEGEVDHTMLGGGWATVEAFLFKHFCI